MPPAQAPGGVLPREPRLAHVEPARLGLGLEHQRVEHFIRQGVALLDEDPDHQTVGAGVGHFAEEEEGGGGVEDWDGDFGDDGGDDDGFF